MPGRRPSDSCDAPAAGPDAIVLPADDVGAWCRALGVLAARADAGDARRGHLCLPCADPDAARRRLEAARRPLAAGPGAAGAAGEPGRARRWLDRLLAGWPPALPGLHRIELETGRWLVSVLHRLPSRTLRRLETGFRAPAAAEVLVVGAGLAGCAVADALLRRGCSVTVLDAAGTPGGVVAGLPWLAQHPSVSPDRRSRLLLQALLTTDRLRDRLDGVFVACGRLQPMPIELARRRTAGLPASLVSVRPDGLWFARAAVADPAAWWRRLERRDGLRPRTGVRVASLVRDQAAGRWLARDAQGRAIASAEAVVLANAGDAFRLAAMPPVASGRLRERRIAVRVGASTAASAAGSAGASSGAVPVMAPVHGGDGRGRPFRIEQPGVCCVLGPDPRDEAPAAGAADEALVADDALTGDATDRGTMADDAAGTDRAGGAGWQWRIFTGGPRLLLRDNLPMAGPVPDCAAVLGDRDRYERDARLALPTVDGLHLLTGLGGRGLLWSVIGAERIAADLAGEPPLLEPEAAEAIAPDRFLVRTLRRTRRGRGASAGQAGSVGGEALETGSIDSGALDR